MAQQPRPGGMREAIEFYSSYCSGILIISVIIKNTILISLIVSSLLVLLLLLVLVFVFVFVFVLVVLLLRLLLHPAHILRNY